MARRMGWAVVTVAVASLVGCALEDSHRPVFHDESKDNPELSAGRIGEPWEQSDISQFLNPQERAALARSGAHDLTLSPEESADGTVRWVVQRPTEAEADTAPVKEDEGMLDKAGRVGVVVFGVGLSVAAAVAPYLLF